MNDERYNGTHYDTNAEMALEKNGQPMHLYIASDELKSLIIHMCVQWYYLPTHPVTNNVLLGLWMHHSTIWSVYVGNVPDHLKIGVTIILQNTNKCCTKINKFSFQNCYSEVDALSLPL